MGASILRPSDRDKERTQGCRSIPQTAHQRRIHNVPVLNLHQALPQQRECQRTHQARKTASARTWQGGNPVYHRQAVRQYGNFLRSEAGKQQSCGSAVGIVLMAYGFNGSMHGRCVQRLHNATVSKCTKIQNLTIVATQCFAS